MTMFNFGTASGKVRPAAVAGQFYPGDKKSLTDMLKECYADAEQSKPANNVLAVIVPHAGYVFSGAVAASAFASIAADRVYEHIFLIGPSHHIYMDSASVNTQYDAYATPLGEVPVDRALCQRLIDDNPDCFTCNPKAHVSEHCLEVQLPLLQYHFNHLPEIVPIIVASQSGETIYKVAEALKPYFNEKNLFVISSDFSHYPSYEDAELVDKVTADSIMTGSPRKFVNALEKNENAHIGNLATSACGQSAILTLLYITSQTSGINIEHIEYRNSGDSRLYGEKDRVVGYHSFIFTHTEDKAKKTNVDNHDTAISFSLSDSEKKTLLAIARGTIANRLCHTHSKLYDEAEITDTLNMHCGAFVTLNEGGRLRGCIGMLRTEEPLYRTVAEMAEEAAFSDPRFPALDKDELSEVEIEISVLSPLHRISSIDEFILGKHGIYMRKGTRSGTFLPQVADEVNWTKEDFFGHCAQDKAGIGWDGWRQAELFTYEAVIIKE